MALKLIYTSAPRLLQAGRSGFGTVAMSRGIPPEAVKAAEGASQFSRQAGFPVDRVIYSYRTIRCADGIWHILSCVGDAGADYSGRTNHLAQHLILSDGEASGWAARQQGPASVILGTAWPPYDGSCGWMEDVEVHGIEATETHWAHYAASAGCRHNLSTEAARRGAIFAYGQGLELQTDTEARAVLCLLAESQAECPQHGWGTTFTTGLEPNHDPSNFRWICLPHNSPMLSKLREAGRREWITLDTPAQLPPVPAPEEALPAAVIPRMTESIPVVASAKMVAQPPVHKIPVRDHRGLDVPQRQRQSSGIYKKVGFAFLLLILISAAAFIVKTILLPPPLEIIWGKTPFTYTGKPQIPTGKTTTGESTADLNLSYKKGDNNLKGPPADAGTYEVIAAETRPWWRRGRPPSKPWPMKILRKPIVITFVKESLKINSVTGKTPRYTTDLADESANAKVVLTYGDGKKNNYQLLESEQLFSDTRPKRVKAEATSANYTGKVVAELTYVSGSTEPPRSEATPAETLRLPEIKYYLGLGSDALTQAKKQKIWKDVTSYEYKFNEDGYNRDKGWKLLTSKGQHTTDQNQILVMDDGEPAKKAPNAKRVMTIQGSKDNSDDKIILFELEERDNSSQLKILIEPGTAMIYSVTKDKKSRLFLSHPKSFFNNVTLLGSDPKSEWIISYEDTPYGEDDPLQLEYDIEEGLIPAIEKEIRKLTPAAPTVEGDSSETDDILSGTKLEELSAKSNDGKGSLEQKKARDMASAIIDKFKQAKEEYAETNPESSHEDPKSQWRRDFFFFLQAVKDVSPRCLELNDEVAKEKKKSYDSSASDPLQNISLHRYTYEEFKNSKRRSPVDFKKYVKNWAKPRIKPSNSKVGNKTQEDIDTAAHNIITKAVGQTLTLMVTRRYPKKTTAPPPDKIKTKKKEFLERLSKADDPPTKGIKLQIQFGKSEPITVYPNLKIESAP